MDRVAYIQNETKQAEQHETSGTKRYAEMFHVKQFGWRKKHGNWLCLIFEQSRRVDMGRSERKFREFMEDFMSRKEKRHKSEDDYLVKLKIELDCEWDDELLLAIMNIWHAGYMVGEGNTLKVEDERWVANAIAIDREFKRRIASYGN